MMAVLKKMFGFHDEAEVQKRESVVVNAINENSKSHDELRAALQEIGKKMEPCQDDGRSNC